MLMDRLPKASYYEDTIMQKTKKKGKEELEEEIEGETQGRGSQRIYGEGWRLDVMQLHNHYLPDSVQHLFVCNFLRL